MKEKEDKKARAPGFFRRILRLFVTGIALLLVAAVGASLYAYFHLTEIALWAAHRILPAAEIDAEQVTLHGFSRLSIDRLEIRTEGQTAFLASELEVDFHFRELWDRQIRRIVIEAPEFTITPAITNLMPGGAQPEGGGASWRVDRFEIKSGSIAFRGFDAPFPEATARIELAFDDLDADSETPGKLVLQDLEVHNPGGTRNLLAVPKIEVGLTIKGIRQQAIESLRIASPQIALTPEALKLLPPQTPESSSANGAPAFRIDELRVTNGSLTVRDFEDLPDVTTGFSVSADHLTSTSESPVNLALTDLEIRAGNEESPPTELDVAEAVIAFTPAHLQRRKIDSIAIGESDTRITPALTSFLPEASATEQADQAGPTGTEQTVDPTAEAEQPESDTPSDPRTDPNAIAAQDTAGWSVDRLTLEAGNLEVIGFGETIPDFALAFEIEGQDLSRHGDSPVTISVSDFTATVDHARSGPPLAKVDSGTIEVTPKGLANHRIESLTIDSGRLQAGQAFRDLFSQDEPAPPREEQAGATRQADKAVKTWQIGELAIQNVKATVGDLGQGIPNINLNLDTVMEDIALGEAEAALATNEHQIELSNITIVSPVDPFVKVLTLRSVFIRFTLAGLVREKIAGLTILSPAIYVSRDLFWYMDYFGKDAEVTPTDEAEDAEVPGWEIEDLGIFFGKLVLAAGGRAQVGLPLGFETEARNVSFENLAGLELKASLNIPEQSFEIPGYELEMDDVSGELLLAYPPEEKKNNLVQVLELAEIRWRQYQSSAAWISVTFDEQGVNGSFGSEAYGGYLDGGFSFLFADDFPWIGWVSGTGVEMDSLTEVLAPENARLTGPADFKVQVNASSRHLERLVGTLELTDAGQLRITKLDEILENLPDDWSALKTDLSRIGIETLRDFEYTEGVAKFWFAENQGELDLELDGPRGTRDIRILLHPPGAEPATWSTNAPPPNGDS